MGDIVELSDHKLTDELRRLSAGVSELVWPVILGLPVGPHTIEPITCLIDLDGGATGVRTPIPAATGALPDGAIRIGETFDVSKSVLGDDHRRMLGES